MQSYWIAESKAFLLQCLGAILLPATCFTDTYHVDLFQTLKNECILILDNITFKYVAHSSRPCSEPASTSEQLR